MTISIKPVRILFTLVIVCISQGLMAQNFYHQPISSSKILHKMEKAAVTGTVMYIAAHPDDENTRLISWLTNYKKVDVTYLSLTRGDGGQNRIGSEIREGLGVIRTQELLQARNTDGGSQMFTRANDFGYSKTAEESFKIWNKEKVLEDVVWAIRKTRPDVIITRFSTEKRTGRSTHGHHTASAILASEAFELAGNPKVFPEQLEYVDVWQPKRLFWNTSWWFYGSKEKFNKEIEESPGKYLKLDVSNYIEEFGLSCSEIASLSRSHHKSQGFGSTPNRGNEYEYLQLIKGNEASAGLFDGIDLTWERLGLEGLIKKYQKTINGFNYKAPQGSIKELADLIATIERKEAKDPHLQQQLLNQLNEIIFNCSRVYIEATFNKELVAADETIKVRIRIINRMKDVSLELAGTKFRSYDKVAAPGGTKIMDELVYEQEVNLEGIQISQPYWLNNQATIGMYSVNDQKLIGVPVEPYPLYFNVSLKINGVDFTHHLPIMYSTTDPVKGEVKHPLIIVPSVMVNLQKEVYLFQDGNAEEISMEVIAGSANVSGYAELNLPDGWKCEPEFHKVDLEKEGQRKLVSFRITPSKEEYNGRIIGYFKTDTDVYGLGFQHIIHNHIPPQAIFNSCESRLVRSDISKDPNINKVGYIKGAGDLVPDALVLLGFDVEQLNPGSITEQTLRSYDAVVVGIRAYNTVTELKFINSLLNTFVKEGGVVVVQYNTSHRLVTEQIGPYKLRLSRNRVTEEDAKVELLATEDPILSWPNKISLKDFDSWVQERGLYFPDEWSDKYIPVIRIADTGESSNDGSILVTYHGKGKFVYTGISFFRQLPAGVPGAYKLMANLLSNPD